MYPRNFERVIELFEKLPGVGGKTAQRYAFKLLNTEPEKIDEYAEILLGIKKVKRCKKCGSLSDQEECEICRDETRDKSMITIVENSEDIATIEKTGAYNGLYYVLGGLISSSKKTMPENLDFDRLIERITPEVEEIILGLSPTMDGEMTGMYIEKILKDKNVKITRLANGIPMGATLNYVDEMTLKRAMKNRVRVEMEEE